MFWVRIAKGGRRSEEDRKSGEVLRLLQSGARATDVAKQLCIGRRSVYRIIEAAKGESEEHFSIRQARHPRIRRWAEISLTALFKFAEQAP